MIFLCLLAAVDSTESDKKSDQIKIGDLIKIKNTSLIINTFFESSTHNILTEGCVGVVVDILVTKLVTKKDQDIIKTGVHTLYYIYTSRGFLDAFEFELEVV